MSRLSKLVLLSVLIVFVLACNAINQPLNDAQNLAKTAEALATAMPVETLQSLATNIPVETIQAAASEIPDFANMFNPQGTPVSEWNGIPVMPQATAGQEFPETKTYSFKADATSEDVLDYYKDQLAGLGWSETFSMPGDNDGAISVYSKDSSVLTITVVSSEGTLVVILTLA